MQLRLYIGRTTVNLKIHDRNNRQETTIKDTEIKHTIETRTFSGKTKSPTGTIAPTRRRRKRIRKTNQIRTLGENKRR